MNTKSQLLQSIKETKEQLEALEKELASCKTPTIQESKVGDVLEDGSIVLIKEKNHAIIVSPKETDFYSTWDKLEQNKTKVFQDHGMIPLEWFVPSKELLVLAYKTIPNHFQQRWYWSSSEINASNACKVNFFNGSQLNVNRGGVVSVRAFRVIVF